MTDRNTTWRASSGMPLALSTRRAYSVCALLLMTSRTWSDADSPIVNVTPSTVNDVIRVTPGRTGGSDTLRLTEKFLRMTTLCFALPWLQNRQLRFSWEFGCAGLRYVKSDWAVSWLDVVKSLSISCVKLASIFPCASTTLVLLFRLLFVITVNVNFRYAFC